MDLINGFLSIIAPGQLMWILFGATLGTLVGALPGIGSTAAVAILLPVTFGMNPLSGLIFLMGVYQGSMFGGRISAILVNVPGDSASVVSSFEGYPMKVKGQAGYALTLSAVSSFIGGVIGFIGIVLLSGVLVQVALEFGPPEYFSLMFFALIVAGGFMKDEWYKPLISMLLGLLIATVGQDIFTGQLRLTFGIPELMDGVGFIAIVIGLFGISEVLVRLDSYQQGVSKSDQVETKVEGMFHNIGGVVKNTVSIVRGSIIGFIIGILPGAGATTATFVSYGAEKKLSKTPDKFGTGVEQGLSGPEASNNAAEAGTFVPLFSLGIPGSATGAILLGALIMYGLQPGPLLFENSGPIVWGAIASILVANVILLFLNVGLIPMFTFLIKKSEVYLVPIITIFSVVGIYMYYNNLFSVGVMIIFGIFGYLMRKFNIPVTPFILALVLGPLLEKSFRQSLIKSHNSLDIFFTRPISASLIIITILILAFPLLKMMKNKMFNKNI
ncbi:tripartite tricarboxylate transporter permease [Virgibacillus sp. W0181]|uniref:tripartite tricarboxylate transporter permease n=1 Tax=Virgibacillus sp. W0181 TaxID=3391581 RepID=UPI003F469880